MISEDVKAQMREIAARYPSPLSGMLPCLHLAQETEGYVTAAGMQAVAEVVEAKLDEVESVVTFYSMFRTQPVGAHVIKVCTSISCYLCGSDELLAHLEEKLGIRRGGTTPDGAYTLQAVECLAACGMAPALQVNDEFVEFVSPARADDLLARLARGEGTKGLGSKWTLAGNGASANGTAAGAGATREGAES
jgi:NADH-quinone oxidoreductase E subunit